MQALLRWVRQRVQSDRTHRLLGQTLAILLALALAWFFSTAMWRWLAPTETIVQAAVETAPTALAAQSVQRHFFGVAQQADAAAKNSTVTLVGVISGHPGVAILSVDNLSVNVIEGDEIQPGMKLVRVAPREVEISRDGRSEIIPLRTRSAP